MHHAVFKELMLLISSAAEDFRRAMLSVARGREALGEVGDLGELGANRWAGRLAEVLADDPFLPLALAAIDLLVHYTPERHRAAEPARSAIRQALEQRLEALQPGDPSAAVSGPRSPLGAARGVPLDLDPWGGAWHAWAQMYWRVHGELLPKIDTAKVEIEAATPAQLYSPAQNPWYHRDSWKSFVALTFEMMEEPSWLVSAPLPLAVQAVWSLDLAKYLDRLEPGGLYKLSGEPHERWQILCEREDVKRERKVRHALEYNAYTSKLVVKQDRLKPPAWLSEEREGQYLAAVDAFGLYIELKDTFERSDRELFGVSSPVLSLLGPSHDGRPPKYDLASRKVQLLIRKLATELEQWRQLATSIRDRARRAKIEAGQKALLEDYPYTKFSALTAYLMIDHALLSSTLYYAGLRALDLEMLTGGDGSNVWDNLDVIDGLLRRSSRVGMPQHGDLFWNGRMEAVRAAVDNFLRARKEFRDSDKGVFKGVVGPRDAARIEERMSLLWSPVALQSYREAWPNWFRGPLTSPGPEERDFDSLWSEFGLRWPGPAPTRAGATSKKPRQALSARSVFSEVTRDYFRDRGIEIGCSFSGGSLDLFRRLHGGSTGAIVVANHASFLDTLALIESIRCLGKQANCEALAVERTCAIAAEKIKHRATGAAGACLKAIGALLVEPHTGDPLKRDQVEKDWVTAVRRGELLIVLPEATRSYDGSVGYFRPTFAKVAERAGVPILPAVVSGAFKLLPKWHPLKERARPGIIDVKFLDPVELRDGDMDHRQASETIRRTIMGALPPQW